MSNPSKQKSSQQCECGCGEHPSRLDARFVRGHATRGAYTTLLPIGTVRCNHNAGYVTEYVGHDYPGNQNGFMLQHRLVMGRHLGRSLSRTEHVHHINRDKADNRIENLEIVHQSQHQLHEQVGLRVTNPAHQAFALQLWPQLKAAFSCTRPDITFRELNFILRAYDEWLQQRNG